MCWNDKDFHCEVANLPAMPSAGNPVVRDKKLHFFVSPFQFRPINVLKRVNAFFSQSFAKLTAEFRRYE